MIEIHDMKTGDEYFVGTCTHIHESEEMDAAAARRLVWLGAMHEKGSRVKVASHDGGRTGFLYIMPIEFSPRGPLGHDLMVVPCLYVANKKVMEWERPCWLRRKKKPGASNGGGLSP